jgi:hypothetical protein
MSVFFKRKIRGQVPIVLIWYIVSYLGHLVPGRLFIRVTEESAWLSVLFFDAT